LEPFVQLSKTVGRAKPAFVPSFFTELYEFRHLLRQLIHQQLTLRYRRTALGFLWTLANPLLSLGVTAVVFSLVLSMDLRDFGIFLFAGMVPWTLFQHCATQASGSIIANESLIKKIYIPRHIFPVAVSASLLVDTCLSMGALFLLALALGAKVTPALFFLPVAMALLYVFSLGTALILSVVFVYFRDMEYITNILLQLAYYLTPIIYPLSRIPEAYVGWFNLNPMLHFIALFRHPIYLGVLPSPQAIAITSGVALATFTAGVLVFRAREHDLIFRL
jgi:ABC-2 type transport system permease protein/lipopolysaccharide transport system permease protein